MSVVFRTDASYEIGTGHVMRCLTLAEELRRSGGEAVFISRFLPGNMIEHVAVRGFPVKRLPEPDGEAPPGPPAHAAWAGVHWEEDAEQTRALLDTIRPTWLIVDHYAFDKRWERAVQQHRIRIMVLDDLADRAHCCDLLLDQNLGREAADYLALVPESCTLLIGPRYALLRSEFALNREASLRRRQEGKLEHILVSMGGVDRDNVTGQVLEALNSTDIPDDCRVTVTLGENAPWSREVEEVVSGMKVPTEILQGVEDMAALMAEADLAIGAAGGTAWERCCLGLPSLLIVVAANQEGAARALAGAGAAELVEAGHALSARLAELISKASQAGNLASMSARAATIADGNGASRVVRRLEPAVQ